MRAPVPLLRRPLPVAILIGLVAQLLFAVRVTVPHKIYFDETHYVPAARTLLALARPANIEHPLLGKSLIALSMLMFGDNPLGWRAFSTLAGTAVVMGTYALAWLFWGRLRSAVIAAAIVVLNLTVFIQARIAMLDGFLAAFLVCALACLAWALRAETARQSWRRWIAGSVLMGLAIGCKWTAIPYLAIIGLGLMWVRWRDSRARGWTLGLALASGRQRHGPGLAVVPALAALGGIALVVYLLTFLPAFFYADEPMTLGRLIPFQLTMYREQTQVLPPHPYQSSWWSWPLMIRPIWYLYEQADGAQRGVLLLGNPAVLWGGLMAVAACLWSGWRGRDPRLTAAALLWVASLAIWAIIPKSLGFFYYYYPSSIFLALPIAGALGRHARGRFAYWDEAYLATCAGLFVYFLPIVAAFPLAGPSSFRHWMWFSTWP